MAYPFDAETMQAIQMHAGAAIIPQQISKEHPAQACLNSLRKNIRTTKNR
jgi:hypothetical protein